MALKVKCRLMAVLKFCILSSLRASHGIRKRHRPLCLTLGIAMKLSLRTSHVLLVFALGLAACSENSALEADVFTLYSTNLHDYGRSGVATYDLAKEPFNSMMCTEAADLYQADFENRKRENGWSNDTKMRYWCEKGRFKK